MQAAAPGLFATLRDQDDIRQALWAGFSGPASDLVLHLHDDGLQDAREVGASERDARGRLVDAQAAIVIIAGAALFLRLVVGNDDDLRNRVIDALSVSLVELVDVSRDPRRTRTR